MSNKGGSTFSVVIPAAGIGRRMGSTLPKQYMTIAGRPVLEHVMHCFLTHPALDRLVVVLRPGDVHWQQLACADDPRVQVTFGGDSRADSVLAGLKALSSQRQEDDWVMVHDAVRPCLTHALIDRLRDTVESKQVGGLLALPLTDSLKQVNDRGEVVASCPRDGYYRAQTPQMFRCHRLFEALSLAIASDLLVTDSASAMHVLGVSPCVVEGAADNMKITYPGDQALAEFILQRGLV